MSKSVKRIFDIIKRIGRSSQGITFSELLKSVCIPKSSLHNILKELQEEAIIDYNNLNKRYYIGHEFNRISSICLSNINLLSLVSTEVSNLSVKLDETAHAGIISERYVTYVAKSEGPSKVSSVDSLGMTVPAHCSSLGKVLLTIYTNKELKTLFKNIAIERYTDNTITNFDALQDEIELVRKNGFAVDYGELSSFAACVAVPVYQYDKIVAAISITVPIQKFTDDYKKTLIKHLLIASDKIGKNLSCI